MKTLMNNEIKARLESREWSRTMAGSVMARRRSRTARVTAAASIILAAGIAASIFLFRDPASPRAGYAGFIASQTEGTYGTVFDGTGSHELPASESGELIFSDDVDRAINEGLAMRD